MLQQRLQFCSFGSCRSRFIVLLLSKWVVPGSTAAACSAEVHTVRRLLSVAAAVADRGSQFAVEGTQQDVVVVSVKAAAERSLNFISHW
jgi:hypothetical protein